MVQLRLFGRLYGIAEIAETLGVKSATVSQWYRRNQLPEPDEILKMGPVWSAENLNRALWEASCRLEKAEARLKNIRRKYPFVSHLKDGQKYYDWLNEVTALDQQVSKERFMVERLGTQRW